MEIQLGGEGGGFELGNPEGRGPQAVWKSRWMGGSKNHAFCRGGVDFFRNNSLNKIQYIN